MVPEPLVAAPPCTSPSSRRVLLCLPCLALSISMVSCFDDGSQVSLGFKQGRHPELRTLDVGGHQEERFVYADHDVQVAAYHNKAYDLKDLDESGADRIKSGAVPFPARVRFIFSPTEAGGAKGLSAVKLLDVSLRQDGKTSACTRPASGKTNPSASDPFSVAADKELAKDGGASRMRTLFLNYDCTVTNRAFDVMVTYELESMGGDAEDGGNAKDAGVGSDTGATQKAGAPKTLVVPFEPDRFHYQQYNKAFAACMGV